MERFDNYLSEELRSEENVIVFLEAALEQYYIDNNRELFLLALKETDKAKNQ